MRGAPTTCVVVPTYQRPEWLRRAVASLAVQTRRPDAVVAVCRDTDAPSHAVVRELADLHRAGFPVFLELVSEPGHMPPVARGLRRGAGIAEIVAVMDDDAEAEPEWLERLARLFEDVSVAAAGGRYVNMDGPTPAPVPVRSVLGRVDFWGRVVGNLYCEPDRAGPRDADFLIGGNMAYRREIVPRLEFDLRLNEGVAFNYEVDLGLQLRAMELRIMVDPSARVRHYSAPRATAGMRRRTEESVRDYARNLVLVMGRRLPLARRIRALLFHLVVGDRTAWGPGSVLANLALTGRLPERGAFGAAQRGKLEAVLALLGGTPRPY